MPGRRQPGDGFPRRGYSSPGCSEKRLGRPFVFGGVRGFLWRGPEGPTQKRAAGSAMARRLGEKPREGRRHRSPEGPARGEGCGGATGLVLKGAERPEGPGRGRTMIGRMGARGDDGARKLGQVWLCNFFSCVSVASKRRSWHDDMAKG
jgi:hypothetical protein